MTTETKSDSGQARKAPPALSSISVIVPTYHEVDNIALLAERLQSVRDSTGHFIEVLLMDDDSRDGSRELVERLGLPWLKLVTRPGNRGLSHAVLDGIKMAAGDILVVMDADLSHPPEKIPALIAALEHGNEIAVGSRFAEGGSTADNWGLLRWLNSRVATLLALPLTTLSDPMSGFFAMHGATFRAGRDFNPVGYKILLELIIKCRCQRIVEIPIHFDNRRFGESKLSLAEQLKYIKHLRRLYIYKYGTLSHLVQFLTVGASGLAVNLVALTVLLRWGLAQRQAVTLAIGLSMLWNFVLNRRFSFSYARDRSIVSQFLGFVAACAVGAVVNYFTTIRLWEMTNYKQLPALAGVLAGTLFNFIASRFVIFRAKHVKP